jgi:hypothetical protein
MAKKKRAAESEPTVLKIEQVPIGGKIWQVHAHNGRLQIVDPEGRQRHMGHSHLQTGIRLALMIAQHAKDPRDEYHGPIDEALRRQAEQFLLDADIGD